MVGMSGASRALPKHPQVGCVLASSLTRNLVEDVPLLFFPYLMGMRIEACNEFVEKFTHSLEAIWPGAVSENAPFDLGRRFQRFGVWTPQSHHCHKLKSQFK
jgi:hypothetical protein